jgi:NADPH:quinone reductase
LPAPVLERTGGAGVDVVFDSVGKPTLRHDLEVTRVKGLVVSFGASGGTVDDLNPAELGEAGSLYLTRPRLKDHLPDAATIQARADALYSGLADGSLSLSLGRRYAMDQIRAAHTDVEQRRTGGKPLLDIAP